MRCRWQPATTRWPTASIPIAAPNTPAKRSPAPPPSSTSAARSVGRTGSCFDNAQAESFNASLKVERVNRTVYPTREHARADVARYIEFRYNSKRLHSALGYRTPKEVHNDYMNGQLAA